MNNTEVLIFAIKILIILAQTSDMSPSMKTFRVSRLNDLLNEVKGHD